MNALREVSATDVGITDVVKRRGEGSSEVLQQGDTLRAHGAILHRQLTTTLAEPGVRRVLLIPVQDRTEDLMWRALDGEHLAKGVEFAEQRLRFWGQGPKSKFKTDLSSLLASQSAAL